MIYITFAGFLSATLLAATSPAPPSDEPLEPEKAFALSAALAPGSSPGIDLRFAVADGYYLYRDRFRIEAPRLPTGPAEIPAGIPKDDPFVGRTVILKGETILRVPFTGSVPPGRYVLKVTAQGCAEEKLCYTPFTQTATVVVPPGYGTSR